MNDDDLEKCRKNNIVVPIGAQGVLLNKLSFLWYELTDDPNHPNLKKVEKKFLPDSREQLRKEGSAESNSRQAVAFSHIAESRKEIEKVATKFVAVKNLHAVFDGILMDKRSLDEMEGFDYHIECDREGNVQAIFLMKLGWNAAFNKKQVCNYCGAFPAYARCFKCNGGTFCTDECYLRATRCEVHNEHACKLFIQAKVAAENPVLIDPNAKDEEEEEKKEEEHVEAE